MFFSISALFADSLYSAHHGMDELQLNLNVIPNSGSSHYNVFLPWISIRGDSGPMVLHIAYLKILEYVHKTAKCIL